MWHNNETFHRGMIQGTLWERAKLSYDLFVLHARWNQNEIAKVMNDTGNVFYLASLRDPVDAFRSFWDMVGLGGQLNISLEDFSKLIINFPFSKILELKKAVLKKALELEQPRVLESLEFKKSFIHGSYYFNIFGIDHREIQDIESVKRKIHDIETMFDKIVIVDQEYIEDSFILLKDTLCWDYRDMVHYRLNSRPTNSKSYLSSTARQALKGI